LETGYNEVELRLAWKCAKGGGGRGRYGVDDGVGEGGADCARDGVAERRELGLRHLDQVGQVVQAASGGGG